MPLIFTKALILLEFIEVVAGGGIGQFTPRLQSKYA
jgi:hypothetical protein